MSKKIISNIKTVLATKWSLITMAVFVIGFILLIGVHFYVEFRYKETFLPGITIQGVEIGGMDFENAKSAVDKKIDYINRRGFVYTTKEKPIIIYPNLSAMESTDSPYVLVDWDVDRSLYQAQKLQENKSIGGLLSKVRVLFFGSDFPIIYSWDRKQHLDILQSSFSDLLTEKTEASFEFAGENLKIIPEKVGQTFDYDKALAETKDQIEKLITGDIKLGVIEDKPIITAATIKSMETDILGMKNLGGLYLTFETSDWFVANETWRQWLRVQDNKGNFFISLEKQKFVEYLETANIKGDIEVEVQDAKFSLENNRVTEFSNSQAGRKIDVEVSLNKIRIALAESGELEVELAVIIEQPRVATQDVNDLGITEIIGTGESDFSGSPSNRVHNITLGADTLNGLLIAPGEEFSLVGSLGDIDGEAGYLQELVIKGNKTIPEYGGGLCQIGTTVFRGALASGLEITERRNHSYRVSYYEPAGTDATIYSPWPDFKFLNDTENYILLQTRIEDTKIYFDYWGTSDGRTVSTTSPIIYNIVSPPARKEIKTTDLEPGKIRCTERAHNGADAKFDYMVQYPDEEEPREITFYSHYIPWQEVCLVGVTEEELAAEQEGNATTTPDEIE
ncbi:hypothetical protein HN859_01540 [Candidatus Parcubacteria bacterium]|jgi:vancomycin resistance protein YoaR|nr:hypothetical protein [Candidatus Parcubacteria bacterium]